MNTLDFLTANRDIIINFYNSEIKGLWNISLKDFMLDLKNNFRKATIATIKGYTRTDLTANLIDAKSRLGLMDTEIIAVDKVTEKLKSKYKNTAYMAIV